VELLVGLIGLTGAFVGLATAVVSRRREVVHRQEFAAPGGEAHTRPPGALVFRSTLFGFAIGTFFGVMLFATILTFAKLAKAHDEERTPRRIEQQLRHSGGSPAYQGQLKERYAEEARQRREDAYYYSLQQALMTPLPCSLLGTFIGLWIGLRLARLSAGPVPRA
jgi:hypothetical protein